MSQRYSLAAVSIAFVISFVGCSSRTTAAPVDVALAQSTLARVLDGWKAGDSPSSFRQESPEVVVQDIDWMSGVQLLDYEIQGPGVPQDANLLCNVQLTLQDKQGESRQKKVTYIVGTDPVLTVFREMF